MTEALGWFSSGILVVTIARQVWLQWRTGRSEGISPWLFIGQAIASLGFTIYSALVGNVVFVVTNGLLTLSALTGLAIVMHHRRRAGRLRPSDARRPDHSVAPAARAPA